MAEAIALREIHSELYSTSGDWDLLMKLYIPDGHDIGKFINDELLDIDGIERSLTTLTSRPSDRRTACRIAPPVAPGGLSPNLHLIRVHASIIPETWK